MASSDQNQKISRLRSVFAVRGLKLLRFHFGNLSAVIGGEVVYTSA